MTFTSIADLYFTSVGLLGLNVIVDVLMDTGLIYLPFIIVITESLYDGFKSSKNMSDTAFTLRTMEVKCYSMLIVMLLFFIPLMPYTIESTATYERMCAVTGERSTVEVDGAEFSSSSTLLDVSGYDLKVPALLNFTINIGNGVTVESINRLPCSINIVGMNQAMISKNISNADLALEVKEFMYQCYQPARSLALQNRDMNIPWIENPNISRQYQSWPGHSAFRNDQYYGNISKGMYSKTPLPGWQSSPNNELYAGYENLDEYEQGRMGYPSCLELWDGLGSGFNGTFTTNDINKGLRARLIDDLQSNQPEDDFDIRSISSWFSDKGIELDEQIRQAFFNVYDIDMIKNFESKDYADETEGVAAEVWSWGARLAGTYGAAKETFVNSAGASIIQVTAPLAKSVLIFCLLVPFPLALLISNFSMKFSVEYMFFFFAVLFCPFLWEITILAQQSFIEETLTGTQDAMGGEGITENVNGLWSLLSNPNTSILSLYFTDALFMVFPTILIGVFTAAGMRIGTGMGSMASSFGNNVSASGSAGKSGGSAAQGEVKDRVNGAKKATGKGPSNSLGLPHKK